MEKVETIKWNLKLEVIIGITNYKRKTSNRIVTGCRNYIRGMKNHPSHESVRLCLLLFQFLINVIQEGA